MFLNQKRRMMISVLKVLLRAGVFVGLAVTCVDTLRAEGTKPQQLFDGSTFRGWEGDIHDTWRIDDGAIAAGSHHQAAPRNEFLATTRVFRDFDLRVKFTIEGDEKLNAGIQFRTSRIPDHHEVIGYQADIGSAFDGQLYDESRRRRMLAGPDPETLKMARQAAPDDGWQTYRIRAVGDRIQLWLNGVKTVDYVEHDEDIPRAGIIAVQIHGGMRGIISYSDVEIVELSVPEADSPSE